MATPMPRAQVTAALMSRCTRIRSQQPAQRTVAPGRQGDRSRQCNGNRGVARREGRSGRITEVAAEERLENALYQQQGETDAPQCRPGSPVIPQEDQPPHCHGSDGHETTGIPEVAQEDGHLVLEP